MEQIQWWRVVKSDGGAFDIAVYPGCNPVTHVDVMAWYGATDALPYVPPVIPPSNSMDGNDKIAVMRWLESIGERGLDAFNRILELCRRDKASLSYFVERAGSFRKASEQLSLLEV